ncbi:MAG: M56 family metallopeptidase [Roseburia sp.]|nr:M56 family metallopeptidase [Roseburia sp.]
MWITILSSSVLIGLVLLLRYIFRGKVRAGVIYALWGVVLLRLLIPVQIFALPAGVQDFFTSIITDVETGENETDIVGQQETQVASYDINPADAQTDGTGRLNEYDDTVKEAEENGILSELPEDKISSSDDQLVTGEREDRISGMSDAAEEPKQITNIFRTHGKELMIFIWAVPAVLLLMAIFISNWKFYYRLKKDRRIFQNEGSPVVYHTNCVHVPCLYGLFRPAIYLPEEPPETLEAAAGDSEEEQAYIIYHERMHYRHLDHVWSVVRIILICAYWFHPLVWIAARVSKQDAEYAADEAVVKDMGYEERFRYGKAILGTLRRGGEKGKLLSIASTASSSKREITKRIENISTRGKHSAAALVILTALVLSLTACAFSGRDSGTNETDTGTDTASPGAVSAGAVGGTDSPAEQTEDQKLEEAISQVLKEDMWGKVVTSSTWQYANVENMSIVESHMLLEKEETKKQVTVYAVTLAAAYGTGVKGDGKERELCYTCRGSSPDFCVITFDKKDGDYVEKETWHAAAKKDEEIRKMFPETVSDEELSWTENDYIMYLTGENERKAFDELKKQETVGTKEKAKELKPLKNIEGTVVRAYDSFGMGYSTDYDPIPELVRKQSGVSEFTEKLVDAFNQMKLVPVHDLKENSMDVRSMITIDFISDNERARQIMIDANRVCWVDGQPQAFVMDESVFDYKEIQEMIEAAEIKEGRCRSPFTGEEIIDAETDIQFLNQLLGNSPNINGGFLEARAKKLCKINGTTRYEEYKSQCEHFLTYKKMYLAAKEDGVAVTDDEAEAYINDLKNSMDMLGKKETLERYCKQKGISEKTYWEFTKLFYKLQYPDEKVGDDVEEFQEKLDKQQVKILDGPHVDLSVKKGNITNS